MKKKLIVVLMLVLLAPAFIFADIMQLGLNVGYGLPFDELTSGDDDVEYFAAENFKFAPELRFNIFFLQLDLVPQLSFGKDYFMAHGYSRSKDGASLLFLREMTWDADGWPVVDASK